MSFGRCTTAGLHALAVNDTLPGNALQVTMLLQAEPIHNM